MVLGRRKRPHPTSHTSCLLGEVFQKRSQRGGGGQKETCPPDRVPASPQNGTEGTRKGPSAPGHPCLYIVHAGFCRDRGRWEVAWGPLRVSSSPAFPPSQHSVRERATRRGLAALSRLPGGQAQGPNGHQKLYPFYTQWGIAFSSAFDHSDSMSEIFLRKKEIHICVTEENNDEKSARRGAAER